MRLMGIFFLLIIVLLLFFYLLVFFLNILSLIVCFFFEKLKPYILKWKLQHLLFLYNTKFIPREVISVAINAKLYISWYVTYVSYGITGRLSYLYQIPRNCWSHIVCWPNLWFFGGLYRIIFVYSMSAKTVNSLRFPG